jgi:hypothetical protein
MMTGIDAVRRTSDSITRQSLQAIEGPVEPRRPAEERIREPGASDLRRHQPVRQPGHSIVQAASALEHANSRIDNHPAEAPRRAERHS